MRSKCCNGIDFYKAFANGIMVVQVNDFLPEAFSVYIA